MDIPTPGEIFDTAALGLEHLRRIHKGADHEDLDVNEFEDFVYATSRRRIESQPAEKQECPFCQTVVANTIKKFGAHVGQHFREIALTAIPVPTVIEPGVDFETYGSEDSGADETGNESNELPVDGISNSESLPGGPLDMLTPSLKTVKAEFNSRYQQCVGTTKLHRRCRWSIPRARVYTFLDTLREVQESKRIELSDLEKLARYALCTRWHQYQDTRIAKEWLKEITKLDTE